MDKQLSDSQISQLRDELSNRRKLAAVKLYKEWAECSLLEAKNFVESLADGNVATGDQTGSNLDDRVMDRILDALQKGNKLEAVKLYKESSGLSLMESKKFIEKLMSELGVEDSKGSGCAGMILAALITSGAALSLLV